LLKEKPSKKDILNHINQVKQAEHDFEANATCIDRGTMRKIMKGTVNTFFHATGLFIITNTLNALITGNYLFFNKTRSSGVINAASDEVLNLSSHSY
jgi:hypothetical protein